MAAISAKPPIFHDHAASKLTANQSTLPATTCLSTPVQPPLSDKHADESKLTATLKSLPATTELSSTPVQPLLSDELAASKLNAIETAPQVPQKQLVMLKKSFAPLPPIRTKKKKLSPDDIQKLFLQQQQMLQLMKTQSHASVLHVDQLQSFKEGLLPPVCAVVNAQPPQKRAAATALYPHDCPHHTSCVIGKCSECFCKECQINQVSGKRVVKPRKN